MKALLFLLLTLQIYGYSIAPTTYRGKVKFIQQMELKYNFGRYNFSELSGLAYDSNKRILYMVSDKGALFSFDTQINDKSIKLKPKSAHYLKRKNGKRLKKRKRDSEGVALDSKGKLAISFEGKPKIAYFNKNGTKKSKIELPKALKYAKPRSRNKSLESLTFHPKYGFITALEYPKRGDGKEYQTLYSSSGKIWHYTTDKIKKNAITAIELMDDGNLLVLERAYQGIFNRYIITLRKVIIKGCMSALCKSEKIIQMDSDKGWDLEDFEGLAKVAKNRYLLISDDSNSIFLKTLLIYFEIGKNRIGNQ